MGNNKDWQKRVVRTFEVGGKKYAWQPFCSYCAKIGHNETTCLRNLTLPASDGGEGKLPHTAVASNFSNSQQIRFHLENYPVEKEAIFTGRLVAQMEARLGLDHENTAGTAADVSDEPDESLQSVRSDETDLIDLRSTTGETPSHDRSAIVFEYDLPDTDFDIEGPDTKESQLEDNSLNGDEDVEGGLSEGFSSEAAMDAPGSDGRAATNAASYDDDEFSDKHTPNIPDNFRDGGAAEPVSSETGMNITGSDHSTTGSGTTVHLHLHSKSNATARSDPAIAIVDMLGTGDEHSLPASIHNHPVQLFSDDLPASNSEVQGPDDDDPRRNYRFEERNFVALGSNDAIDNASEYDKGQMPPASVQDQSGPFHDNNFLASAHAIDGPDVSVSQLADVWTGDWVDDVDPAAVIVESLGNNDEGDVSRTSLSPTTPKGDLAPYCNDDTYALSPAESQLNRNFSLITSNPNVEPAPDFSHDDKLDDKSSSATQLPDFTEYDRGISSSPEEPSHHDLGFIATSPELTNDDESDSKSGPTSRSSRIASVLGCEDNSAGSADVDLNEESKLGLSSRPASTRPVLTDNEEAASDPTPPSSCPGPPSASQPEDNPDRTGCIDTAIETNLGAVLRIFTVTPTSDLSDDGSFVTAPNEFDDNDGDFVRAESNPVAQTRSGRWPPTRSETRHPDAPDPGIPPPTPMGQWTLDTHVEPAERVETVGADTPK